LRTVPPFFTGLIMEIQANKKRYNSTVYDPRIDYSQTESHFAFLPIKPYLESIIAPGVRALDLGCNAGRFTFLMEEMGAKAVGVDFASAPLRIARRIAEQLGSQCQFVEASMLDLPFEDRSFDLAILPKVIIELSYQDFDLLCQQLSRKLSPHGHFCFTLRDALRRIDNDHFTADSYQASTGLKVSLHDLPDIGLVEYHTYFWTVAYAKTIASRWLECVNEIEFAPNDYWLEFIVPE